MRKALTALSLATAITASSCAKTDPKGQPSTHNDVPGTSGESSLLYAEGWSDVTLMANYAKTVLDHVAHFTTSRNACGKSAYGALDMGTWNRIATLMNRAIQDTPLTEARCTAMTEPSKMDGTAEVTTDNGKRLLFEVRGWDMCTTVKDPELANQLFAAITQVVLAADKEECPNGWGSG